MFGYLAAITRLELVTGIIIAPQRQTALIAKQAAEVDILAEGRFRLGLGVGWNRVEYESLGQDFRTRGRRQEEQIGLLRRLWTERAVDHDGEFDHIKGAGIAPHPPAAHTDMDGRCVRSRLPPHRPTGRGVVSHDVSG